MHMTIVGHSWSYNAYDHNDHLRYIINYGHFIPPENIRKPLMQLTNYGQPFTKILAHIKPH